MNVRTAISNDSYVNRWKVHGVYPICRRGTAMNVSSILRRTMATFQRNWDLCVSAVELQEGPLYICSEAVPRQKHHSAFEKNFPWKRALALTSYNPGDRSQSNVKNAVAYDKLKKELKASLPNGTSVLSSFAFFPDNPACVERGFFVIVSEDPATSEETETFIKEVTKKYEQAGFFCYEVKEGGVYQKLVSAQDGKLLSECPLVQVAPPVSHPVFSHPSHHSVFHDFNKVRNVLSDCKVSRAGCI